MKIQFQLLTIKNFGTFIEKQSLQLRNLAIGVHFVRGINEVDKLGANGAGKSKMVNAISWCLYGRTTDNLKAVDVKSWDHSGKPRVALIAKFDGVKHRITREGNLLELDNKEIGQETIDNLMHMNWQVFKQTMLFGQKEPLFFDLPNKEKLALLSEVLELDKWEIRSQKASERTRELESREQKHRSNLNLTSMNIENVEKLIKEAIKASKTWATDLAKRLKYTKEEKRKLTEQLEQATKQFKKSQRIGNDAAGKLGEAQATLKIAQDFLTEHNRKLAIQVERARLLTKQQTDLKKELADLKTAKRCPTCRQVIDPGDTTQHRNHLRTKLEEITAELVPLNAKPEPNNLAGKHNHEVITSRVKMVTYQTEVDFRRTEMDDLGNQITICQTKLKSLATLTDERKAEKNPHDATVERLMVELDQLQKTATEFKLEADKASRRAIRSKYWIKGFKDVRLLVIEDVLQELELSTNMMLEDMGLIGWKVKYAVERETQSGTIQTGMTISILSPRNKKAVKWDNWSGGESQRLRLAGALALSEVLLGYAGIEVDLEILDEPTKHLSDQGVSDLVDMLVARAEQVQRRIIYVDHMMTEGAQFASTIVVRKTSDGSFIEQT